ncbi:HAD family hydrolase [Photobacterium sp. R1]
MTMHAIRPTLALMRYAFLLLFVFPLVSESSEADALPSWNDGPSKQAIIQFVQEVTRENSPHFVPPGERIATFDNDGTLWVEQPMYTQLFFVIDRIQALAPSHPEWKTQEPFKSVLQGDVKQALAGGNHSILELMMATHAGMSTVTFSTLVEEWIATAKHPSTGRLFTEMVYQPMLELIAYLQENHFKTYIVSGGGIEFMRPWSERVYGIPPEWVIGSSFKTEYKLIDGVPQLLRMPSVNFIDDKEGKPVGIHQFIGRRPIAAFGNSDGDFQMLQWVTAGDGKRLGLLVHHTDKAREWAYDRHSSVGKLDKALDAAKENGWVVVDMKTDWRTIYPSPH